MNSSATDSRTPPEMADIIVALDVPDAGSAYELVDRLGDAADFYKVGLELYTRAGPEVVRELRSRKKRVFLDLKLHDIPNTVAKAVEAAAALDVQLLTLHATGGEAMMRAAQQAAGGEIDLLGVTLLTSLGASEVEAIWGRELNSVREEVARLAALAGESGLSGVVSSAHEARDLRRLLGPEAHVVTPGIRLAGGDTHDQTRVATPESAVRDGASHLVVGRTITLADDPVAAARAVAESAASGRTRTLPRG